MQIDYVIVPDESICNLFLTFPKFSAESIVLVLYDTSDISDYLFSVAVGSRQSLSAALCSLLCRLSGQDSLGFSYKIGIVLE